MLHLIIESLLYYLSKNGRGRLQEVVACKRFQIQWFDLETFGIIVAEERCSQPEVRL